MRSHFDLIERAETLARHLTYNDDKLQAEVKHTLRELASALAAGEARPIDMVLYCPNCGCQHIDAAEPCTAGACENECTLPGDCLAWANPPHRSHLCHRCQCVWRPADVPTNGVKTLTTRGKEDNWADLPEGFEAELADRPALEILEKIHHAHANALQALMIGKYDPPRVQRWAEEFEHFRALYTRLAEAPAPQAATQGEAVAWQRRSYLPGLGWSEWSPCSREAYFEIHYGKSAHVQARALAVINEPDPDARSLIAKDAP